MRQPDSYRRTAAALAVLVVGAAGVGESRADMAASLASASPTAAGPQAGDPVLTSGMPTTGTGPLRDSEFGPIPNAVAPLNATAASDSPATLSAAMSIVNAMTTPGWSGVLAPSATGPTSTNIGPSSDGSHDAGRLAAVASNGAVANGGAGLQGPDVATGAQVGSAGDAQVPLSAPEPSTLILVVAAVPFSWLFIHRRTAQAD